MPKTITANMLDAKTRLSALVDMVQDGQVDEVVIARGGRPAVRIVRLARRGVRLGRAKARFQMPSDTATSDCDVLELFGLDRHAHPA
ncbi:MAG: hypothetical protein WKG00_06125 [Polyangiaceae bacterium]